MTQRQSDQLAPILVVDDDAATARSVAALLKSAGYSTDFALSGREAIAKIAIARPIGAFIDIHLPDLNGLVLAGMFRKQLGPSVPIFVLSGDTSIETMRTLPHIGASYFLSKPINSLKLLEFVRRWFPRRSDNDGRRETLIPEPV